MQGSGPYAKVIKKIEDDIQEHVKKVNELAGIKESDTGLSVPSLWDLPADKQALQSEEPLQVGIIICHRLIFPTACVYIFIFKLI